MTPPDGPVTPNASSRLRKKRWPWMLVAFVALIIGGLAALPWLLASPAGTRLVLGRLNRAFAPGRLDVASFRFSWFGSTRLGAVRLVDPNGKTVVTAAAARLSPGLWGLILRPRELGTLSLEGASFTVHRRNDGSIDLADALSGILANPDPRRDLTIRADQASLNLYAEGLIEPVVQSGMDLLVSAPPAPAPVSWTIDLDKGAGRSLQIVGDFDRSLARPTSARSPDFSTVIRATRWPIAFERQGIELNADLQGRVRLTRKSGSLQVDGLTEFPSLRLTGPRLQSDTLNLDTTKLTWSIAQDAGAWSVEQIEAKSPVGEVSASWAESSPRLKGRIDLAAVARQIPRALWLREGLTVEQGVALVDLKPTPGANRSSWTVEATVSDLKARQGDRPIGLRDPARLSVLLARRDQNLAVERLDLKTAGIDVSAHGDLEKGLDLNATIDLAAFRAQLADWVDLKSLELAGQATATASYRRKGAGYVATSRFDAQGLKIAGVLATPVESARSRFEVNAEGDTDPSGWPRSLVEGHLTVESGQLLVNADLRPGEIRSALNITARSPITLASQQGRVEGRVVGKWDHKARSLAIDDLQMIVQSAPDGPRLAWDAQGTLDVANGSLTLLPSRPIDDSAAIALGADGIKVVGLGGTIESIRAEGSWVGNLSAVDAVLGRWSGRPPRGLDGHWTAIASAKPGNDGLTVAARWNVDDLSWPGDGGTRTQSDGPVLISVRSVYSARERRLQIAELAVVTPYAKLEGGGQIDRIGESSVVDIRGVIAPDWDRLTTMLARRVEPGAKIIGSPHPFEVRGPLVSSTADGPPEPIGIGLGLSLTEADLFGMKLGATPIDVTIRGDTIGITPIETTLNAGRLRLAPTIDLDDPAGAVVRLDADSSLSDAVVNEEVSRRVLSFVAPVLDRTTRASGRVSVTIDEASFPVVRDVGRRADISGSVVFQDLEFAPGPLARQMFALVTSREPQNLRLNNPVLLSIAEGRVNQTGLAFPLGDVTQVELSGWVDFDKNLGLVASLPITPEMFPNSPKLGLIVSGTKIRVPISGTLANPKLDKMAFNDGLKDMGTRLLTRTAGLGALELLNNLTKPRVRDPDAPPPPTAAERRAFRIEKKNQRRMNRGLPPVPGPDGP